MRLRVALAASVLLLAGGCLGPQTLNLDYGLDQTESVTISGARIEYLERGIGTPIVFYHPGLDFRYWQWSIDAASQSNRVIALPHGAVMPGVSPSDPKSLIAFLDQLGGEPVHLVAHSVGGWQALALAVRRPELLRSLIVVEPAGAPDEESLAAQAEAFLEAPPSCLLSSPTEGELNDCVTTNQLSGSGYYEGASQEFRELLAASGRLLVEALRDAPPDATQFVGGPACEELRQLAVPVLFIRGASTPEAAQIGLDAYEACLPAHSTAVIENAAHYVHLDNPAGFHEVLLAFVNRN